MSDKGQWFVYDFYNQNSLLSKGLITGKMPCYRFFKDLVNTSISMWRYKDIEKYVKGLTSSILETAIMFNRNLCLYNSASLGWILAKYNYSGLLSIYLKPTEVDIMTLNGKVIATSVPFEDLILVKDNDMDIIPYLVIDEYIAKISKVEDCIDKVLNNCSLPLAIVGNKKQAASLKMIANKLGNKDPFIIGDDSIMDNIKGFDINVPISPNELYELKDNIKNECLASQGIYSISTKRERIVTQEISNRNDYVDFIYQGKKLSRENWVNEFNKKADANIVFEEVYDINFYENAKEEADKEAMLAKADAIKENKTNE